MFAVYEATSPLFKRARFKRASHFLRTESAQS